MEIASSFIFVFSLRTSGKEKSGSVLPLPSYSGFIDKKGIFELLCIGVGCGGRESRFKYQSRGSSLGLLTFPLWETWSILDFNSSRNADWELVYKGLYLPVQ